jgi:prolyl oligopeptidase
LRVARDPYGLAGVQLLFGDPTTPEGAQHLASFSPYSLVQDQIDYPAMLIECGESDHRCPPWHTRKLGARLQNARGSHRPVLMRFWKDTGHGSGIDLDTRIEQHAELLAFALRELALTPKQ